MDDGLHRLHISIFIAVNQTYLIGIEGRFRDALEFIRVHCLRHARRQDANAAAMRSLIGHPNTESKPIITEFAND